MSQGNDHPSGDNPFLAEARRYNIDPSNNLKRVTVHANLIELRLRPWRLNLLTRRVRSSTTVSDFFTNLGDLVEKLERSGAFKETQVDILPGEQTDTIALDLKLKERSRFSASFSQFLGRGGATTSLTLGFRNPFGLLDNFRIESGKTFERRQMNNFSLNYSLPYVFGSADVEASYLRTHRMLDRNIEEELFGSHLRLGSPDGRKYISFENSLRVNKFDEETCARETLEQESTPSRKRSLKFGYILCNTLQRDRVQRGKLAETTLEAAYSKDGVRFLKGDFFYKQYIPLAKESTNPRNVLSNLTLETAFYLGKIVPIGSSPLRLNDKFGLHNMRGYMETGDRYPPWNRVVFNQGQSSGGLVEGDYLGSDFVVRTSAKLNFYDFPLLSRAGAKAFFYASAMYLHPQLNQQRPQHNKRLFQLLQSGGRASAGLGVAFDLGGGCIEVLYNFAHLSQATDYPRPFQVRISLND